MEMCKCVFEDATKIQYGRHGLISYFVCAKTQQLNHIPHDVEMCRWFFQGLLKIKWHFH